MSELPQEGFLLSMSASGLPDRRFGFHRPIRAEFSEPGYLADRGEGHAMVFAPTGAGKKRNILLPTLLTARNPVVVIDIKGELALESAAYRRDVLGHQVVILDPWRQVSDGLDGLNMLDVISRDPGEMHDDAFAFARLLYDTAPMKEPYWDETSQSVNAGLIAQVVASATETDRSFGRVWRYANAEDPLYQLAVLLDTQDVDPFARAQISSLLSLNADQTRSCILSVMHQHLRVFASETVRRVTTTTTFDLDAVRSGAPLSIYIVTPPHRLRSHAALLRLWMAALMTLILQRRERPELPTLLLIDEAAQLGRMDQIPQAVTLARGYGLRCMLLWQSIAQLRHAYPGEAETLVENSATLVTFGHTSFGMSRQMADVLGDTSAETLFEMGPDRLALRRAGEITQVARRADYVTDRNLATRAASAKHPVP